MRDKVMIKRLDKLPVRPMPPPQARLINQRLVKLAGHRRLVDVTAAEEPNGLAEASPADPLKVLANVREARIGQVRDADAAHMVVLPAQRLRDEHRITPPC